MSNISFSSRRLVAIKTGLAMAAFITAMGGAEAKEARSNCAVGSEKLSATTTYQNSGASNYRVTRVSWNINNSNPNNPAKNNLFIALRGYGGNVTYWKWTSGDNVREGRGSRSLSVVAPKGAKPYVKYSAVFDRNNASDPSCSTYTRLS